MDTITSIEFVQYAFYSKLFQDSISRSITFNVLPSLRFIYHFLNFSYIIFNVDNNNLPFSSLDGATIIVGYSYMKPN